MTWSKFDDGYDEHEKIEEAWDRDRATVGLHAMATTACNRWLSDGVIRPKWLRLKLPSKRERERVLRAMLDVELFDLLRAGDTLVVTDSDDNEITLGPFDDDRYVVHDFLDRHDSSVQVKAKRKRDAERKAKTRRETGNVRSDSKRIPSGFQADSAGSSLASRAGAGGGPPAPPDPTRPDQEPPYPPEGGQAADLDAARERLRLAAPPRPVSKRQRDLVYWYEQLEAWAAEHFPGASLSGVERLVGEIRGRGGDPTPDAIREFVSTRPAWALALEPAA